MSKKEVKSNDKNNSAEMQLRHVEECVDLGVAVRSFTSCNIFEVKVGTNCPMGGDAGHGGKTLFKVINAAGTSWVIAMKKGEERYIISDPEELTIALFGDTEAETFSQALEFVGRYLKLRMKREI